MNFLTLIKGFPPCIFNGNRKRRFAERIVERLSKTNSAIEGFEPKAPGQNIQRSSFSKELEDLLKKLGSFPALRTARAMSIFERIKPVILEKNKFSFRPQDTLVGIW